MKISSLLFPVLILLMIGCSGDNSAVDSARLFNASRDIENIKSWEEHNPIEVFLTLATKEADEAISLNEGNMNMSIQKANKYENCIIVVDNHTIVRVENLKNCQASGSWKTCMPIAKGFVQKGELQAKEDFLNNIIGKPDLQQRMMFLFDEKQ